MMCIGKIAKKPVVDEATGAIVARETTTCTFNCDHRFGDAANFAPTLKIMQDYVNDPVNFDATKYKDVISKAEQERGGA